MMKRIAGFIFFAFVVAARSQEFLTPLEASHFEILTSCDALATYIYELDRRSDILQVRNIGTSVEGREIYGMFFSKGNFGEDPSKIKVLIFAQQHGSEPSGKEGALLLAKYLTQPGCEKLFNHLELALVPQVNPDGSEKNQRRNANLADLNRNHLLLTEPETQALHRLFDQYRFEVSLDVHEYYPYDSSWIKQGYRKNSEVTLGTATNLNVSEAIRSFSVDEFLPYAFRFLAKKGYSSFEYCPGGPPPGKYLRHSTFDINDGRQSLAVLNTFSCIQEGMNGEDAFADNIRRRAGGQMNGMLGLLKFVAKHKKKIKKLVDGERDNLVRNIADHRVAVQMEHVSTGEVLKLPVWAYASSTDSLIHVTDYRPEVRSLASVIKPAGYLVPVDNPELVDWTKRLSLETAPFKPENEFIIESYRIVQIDSVDFEGDRIAVPRVEKAEKKEPLNPADYLFIPTGQLKGNLVVQALEPESMIGLATYPAFSNLLVRGTTYPVLRAIRNPR